MQQRASSAAAVPAAVLVGLVAVVATLTAASSARLIAVPTVAASPAQIGSGHVWLLITSALLVQKPFALSVASFAALGALTLVVCGVRVFAWAAFLGHICSTLITYGFLALIRVASPQLVAGVWSAPDYGVSAISAAWLGAIASLAWRRRGQTLAGKLQVVISCVLIAAFAWMLRRHVNVLDTEHGIAFVIGGVLSARFAQAKAIPSWERLRHRHARRLAVACAATLVAMAGASFAEALRSLQRTPFPEGRIAAFARHLANNLGDSHPQTAQVIATNEGRAGQLLPPRRNLRAAPTSQSRRGVYLIILRGRFRCSRCSSVQGIAGSFATASWSPRQGLLGLHLNRRRPAGLRQIGPTRTIQLAAER